MTRGAGDGQWAAGLVDDAATALRGLADPGRAGPMRRYMRDQFDFLGITTPQRRLVAREALRRAGPPPNGEAVLLAGEALWMLPEREFTYASCDVLARYHRLLAADAVPVRLRALLAHRPWWDSVDSLAGGTLRPMIVRCADLVDVMWAWSADSDRWLNRVAITHQLGRKAATDPERLFRMCATHGSSREFFVAKAVGWALRDYAYTAPAAVAEFVAAHPGLAPVARREALKHLS